MSCGAQVLLSLSALTFKQWYSSGLSIEYSENHLNSHVENLKLAIHAWLCILSFLVGSPTKKFAASMPFDHLYITHWNQLFAASAACQRAQAFLKLIYFPKFVYLRLEVWMFSTIFFFLFLHYLPWHHNYDNLCMHWSSHWDSWVWSKFACM